MNRNTALDRLPGFAVVPSIVTCYGTLAFASILSLLEITVNIHEGSWADAITLFAWLAFAGVAINFRLYYYMGNVYVILKVSRNLRFRSADYSGFLGKTCEIETVCSEG